MTTGSDDEMLSAGAVADPYGYLGGLRAVEPVYWNARYRSWVLTRHADVSVAMTDGRFSSDRIAPVIARERARARPDLDLVETFELLDRWLVFRDSAGAHAVSSVGAQGVLAADHRVDAG